MNKLVVALVLAPISFAQALDVDPPSAAMQYAALEAMQQTLAARGAPAPGNIAQVQQLPNAQGLRVPLQHYHFYSVSRDASGNLVAACNHAEHNSSAQEQ